MNSGVTFLVLKTGTLVTDEKRYLFSIVWMQGFDRQRAKGADVHTLDEAYSEAREVGRIQCARPRRYDVCHSVRELETALLEVDTFRDYAVKAFNGC